MAPSTPTQGLPSPPPRTPVRNPSRQFPYVFAPQLPKLGTAKVRLRSNVFALSAYLLTWWQRDVYKWAKEGVIWSLGAFIPSDSITWFIGAVESVVLALLLWNIIEAILVIRRAPSSTPTPISTSTPSVQTPAQRRLRQSNIRYQNSPSQSSPLNDSIISPYLDASPSPFVTPVRKNAAAFYSSSPSLSSSQSGNYNPFRASQSFNGGRTGLSTSISSPAGLNLSAVSNDGGGNPNASPLASYFGKHAAKAGRALDGQVLRKLMDSDDL